MKTHSLRASASLFSISIAESVQYRAAAIANGSISITYALIEITVFSVFYLYGANKTATEMLPLPAMVSYIWLKQAMIAPSGIYSEFRSKIQSGDVILELCRPWNLYTHWFAKLAAWRIGGFIWRSILTIAAGLLMPMSYRLGAPASGIHFLIFVASTMTAMLLWLSYSMLATSIRLGVVWGEGPTDMMFLICNLLSGFYLPLQLWPDFMQQFLYWQPFAGAVDLPIRIYVGSMSLNQAYGTIALQLGWSLLFMVLGYQIMRRQTNNMIVHGG